MNDEPIEIVRGTDNIFRDFGMQYPDRRLLQARLAGGYFQSTRFL